jgi:hypothetical protein
MLSLQKIKVFLDIVLCKAKSFEKYLSQEASMNTKGEQVLWFGGQHSVEKASKSSLAGTVAAIPPGLVRVVP